MWNQDRVLLESAACPCTECWQDLHPSFTLSPLLNREGSAGVEPGFVRPTSILQEDGCICETSIILHDNEVVFVRPNFIFKDKEILFLRQTFLTQDVDILFFLK